MGKITDSLKGANDTIKGVTDSISSIDDVLDMYRQYYGYVYHI